MPAINKTESISAADFQAAQGRKPAVKKPKIISFEPMETPDEQLEKARAMDAAAKPDARRKVTNEAVLLLYRQVGNVHKVGALLGVHGQTVNTALTKIGANTPINVLSDEDKSKICAFYEAGFLGLDGTLAEFAASIGRTKHFVCRYAREAGLTNQVRKGVEITRRKAQNLPLENRYGKGIPKWEGKEHPRGMLGKNHGLDAKEQMGKAHSARWAAMSEEEREAATDKIYQGRRAAGTVHSVNEAGDAKRTWKAAWRIIGGVRKYYRSRWEANYARVLQWMLEHDLIKSWLHEPDTFWFEAIKRGVRSYLPDFKVEMLDGTVEYHEVKGWMDDRSKTKIKRMAKYHPTVILKVYDGKWYGANKYKWARLILDWEGD